jgi:hypothetical protein
MQFCHLLPLDFPEPFLLKVAVIGACVTVEFTLVEGGLLIGSVHDPGLLESSHEGVFEGISQGFPLIPNQNGTNRKLS